MKFVRYPAGIYLFKVNNRNIRTRCEICSKLTIKTPGRRHWLRSGVFIVNFDHISHLVYCFYCYLWTCKCRLGSRFKINAFFQLCLCNFLRTKWSPDLRGIAVTTSRKRFKYEMIFFSYVLLCIFLYYKTLNVNLPLNVNLMPVNLPIQWK